MPSAIHLVGHRGYTGRLAAALCPEAVPVGRRETAPPGLVGDVEDPAFARRVAEAASVVVNFVGPFDAYARALAQACVQVGTDYVDITGEPGFVAWSQATLDGPARRSGARLLHAVATESLPAMLLAADVPPGPALALRYRMHLPLMSPGSRITAALSTTRPPVWARGGRLEDVPEAARRAEAPDGVWAATAYPDVVLLPRLGHADVRCWLHLRRWADRAGPPPRAEDLWARHRARPRPGPPADLRAKTEVRVTLEADGAPVRRAVVRDSYRFTAAAAVHVARALEASEGPGGVRAVPEVLEAAPLWSALAPFGLASEAP